MSAHLLAVAVGPVQEFIAAARRTRDLWFGSYLLSEISKATAKAVQAHGGKLIFPAPAGAADLEPGSPLNVANVIVAELDESDPAAVARTAKEAAQSRWREFANSVFERHRPILDLNIWEDQVNDVIEFYAAWYPYADSTYHKDRAALMRLLAERKRCRDFRPAKGRAQVPKSSLDGLRESVLKRREDPSEGSRRPLRLSDGEQLDVVGMVKRAWARPNETPRYPSVERVAADPWLQKVSASPHLKELKEACRTLNATFGNIVHELDVSERGQPHYADFPFEGTAVFRSRYREFCAETDLRESDLAPLAVALKKLTDEFDEPSPYLAVLVADGDRMGRALGRLKSADEHRAFSRALSDFAARAGAVVAAHRGVPVYSGGDDVLAFVPIDRCLGCARELHDTFSRGLADWSAKTGTELTLSVGLAIAHFMEPLEDLRRYGREAEQHAKNPTPEDCGQTERDGLAVHVIKRGGGKVAARANWTEEPDRHLAHLAELIAAKAIPNRVAYDLHAIAAAHDGWRPPEDSVRNAIRLDALSVMRGKQPRGTSAIEEIEKLIRERVNGADSLRMLTHELLIAKALAGGADRL